jgi:hypothetical protein
MNSDLNAQLEPLRSLKTATKKRRMLKEKACPKWNRPPTEAA